MSRPASANLIDSLSPGASAKHFSTVHIKQKDGEQFWFITHQDATIDGQPYAAKLQKVGQLKETLTTATNRVSVTISNLDKVFGLKTASELHPLRMAQVTIRRYTPHIPEHNYYYFGFLSSPLASVPEVTFNVIPRSEAAGLCLANRTISARNGFVNPDPDEQTAPSSGDGGGIGGGTNPGGGHCFVVGTLINSGFNEVKPNDEFEKGSQILSFNKQTLNLELDTVNKVRRKAVNEYLIVAFADGGILRVTKEHPFLTADGKFTKIGDLKFGELVYRLSGGIFHLAAYESSQIIDEEIEVITFTVEKNGDYFADGFAVGNKDDPPIPGDGTGISINL
jgi:hypothetical protein